MTVGSSLTPRLAYLPFFENSHSSLTCTAIHESHRSLPLIHSAQWVTSVPSLTNEPPASADPHRLSFPTILSWSPHAKKTILALTFCQHIPARGWVSVPSKHLPHTEMKSLFNPLPWVLLSTASRSCRFYPSHWIAFFDTLRNSVQSTEFVQVTTQHITPWPSVSDTGLNTGHNRSCFWKDLRSLQFHSVVRS